MLLLFSYLMFCLHCHIDYMYYFNCALMFCNFEIIHVMFFFLNLCSSMFMFVSTSHIHYLNIYMHYQLMFGLRMLLTQFQTAASISVVSCIPLYQLWQQRIPCTVIAVLSYEGNT